MTGERALIVTIERDAAKRAGHLTLGGLPDPNQINASTLGDRIDPIEEIRNLAESAGLVPVGHVRQHQQNPHFRNFLGKGVVERIASQLQQVDASVVLFDCELGAFQVRRLQDDLGTKVRVLDRTQLILEIFALHAASREGQLQVELAHLQYLLPRVGRTLPDKYKERKIRFPGRGNSESLVERRSILRRIRHLQERLTELGHGRERQRRRRNKSGLATVVLVGYTNAGKSTLFNALTSAAVGVSSKLFETVDPTVRPIRLPSRRRALLIDTVGFIRNLPTFFVSGFRATIEEVERASLIVHVTDASFPGRIEQDVHVEKLLSVTCPPKTVPV
jgi:GTPase